MHKQQAQETMRVIEKNMTAEKKLKLEFLLNEIVDTYFALEIGKDTYESYVRLCLDYWTTFFEPNNLSVVLANDLPLTLANANSTFREITISSHIKEKIRTIEDAPKLFLMIAHECAHIDDYQNTRSFHYTPTTHKISNASPTQQGLLRLKNHLLKYRVQRFPKKPNFDEKIKNYANAIYLNMPHEQYAREFNKKAYNIFQNAVIKKNSKNIFQKLRKKNRLKICNRIIKEDYKIETHNNNMISLCLEDQNHPFVLLYNELLNILPSKIQEMQVYLSTLDTNCSISDNFKENEVFCSDILNLQLLQQFYNQDIIDEVKPSIMAMPKHLGHRLQAFCLIADKNTTNQEIMSYIEEAAKKNEPINSLLDDYFEKEYIDSIYANAQKSSSSKVVQKPSHNISNQKNEESYFEK